MGGRILNSPVAFIIFNRPDTTKIVLEQIRKAKPRRLYVIADGPRENVPGERERCAATRAIIETIDWDCQVYKNYAEKNLGCGRRVATGLSWAFEKEDRLIVLEDDTVPTRAFFYFCEEMLEKYLLDSRIWMICGSNFFTERRLNGDSYFFSQYGSIWGWATWKRAWQHYDYSMRNWPRFRDSGLMTNVFKTVEECRRFTQMFEDFYKTRQNNWDVQSLFMNWSNGGLGIIPATNLVTNIGTLGNHTSESGFFHFHQADEEYRIQKHPHFILANRYYDEYLFYKQWRSKRIIPHFITKFIPHKVKQYFNNDYRRLAEWLADLILQIKSPSDPSKG